MPHRLIFVCRCETENDRIRTQNKLLPVKKKLKERDTLTYGGATTATLLASALIKVYSRKPRLYLPSNVTIQSVQSDPGSLQTAKVIAESFNREHGNHDFKDEGTFDELLKTTGSTIVVLPPDEYRTVLDNFIQDLDFEMYTGAYSYFDFDSQKFNQYKFHSINDISYMESTAYPIEWKPAKVQSK